MNLQAAFIRKPVKALAVVGGDHHIHNHPAFNVATPNGYGSRIERSIRSLKRSVEIAQAHGASYIIVNGDLMHTKNSIIPEVALALREFFTDAYKLAVPVQFVLNTGNHERPNKHTKVSTLEIFKDLQNVTVVTEAQSARAECMTLHFFPFFAQREDFEAARETLRRCTHGRPRVLLAHYPLQGADLGNGTRLQDAPLFNDFNPEDYDFALFSDIHKRQLVGTNGLHLGATHSNNFGEAGYELGWWVLGVDANNRPCVWPISGSGVKEFVVTDDEIVAEALRNTGNYVRLDVKAQQEVEMMTADTPRVTSTSVTDLVGGYGTHKLAQHGLSEAEQSCVLERITWCLTTASTGVRHGSSSP